jgi:hypothetical protein
MREAGVTPEATKMKRKRWSEMTTDELAAATKQFDDPSFDPPARKPTTRQLAQLRRVQRKAANNRFRVAVALDGNLVEEADDYAASHGITFSDLVSDALRRLMRKKSA